ncbi:hypothetical protein KDA_11410 [Dictyobacter alpinus]|uniref:Uncharacterized protein n=1 Tax=Dictyobacter alpinus TaxID=2014873 RepID=A0A402B2W8_9CHLR|nr:hypothetical protein KDA_11410 [Dictyobacter alpinus]
MIFIFCFDASRLRRSSVFSYVVRSRAVVAALDLTTYENQVMGTVIAVSFYSIVKSRGMAIL